MRHPFLATGRPLVFAHRGGSALAPENTIRAFDRAIALGVDGLELDVRLSRDGIVVVHHDDRLERTTNGKGRVREYTADELVRLDAGGGDAHIPLFAEVLTRYRDCWMIVEMKDNESELARAVADRIREADAVDRVCLGGFGLVAMREARRYAPDIATSAAKEEVRWALYRSWIGMSPRSAPYAGFQVPEKAGLTRVVSRRFVRAAHARDRFVQVWTVDDPDDMRRLSHWGVDGLITDRPDVAVDIVGAEPAPPEGRPRSAPTR